MRLEAQSLVPNTLHVQHLIVAVFCFEFTPLRIFFCNCNLSNFAAAKDETKENPLHDREESKCRHRSALDSTFGRIRQQCAMSGQTGFALVGTHRLWCAAEFLLRLKRSLSPGSEAPSPLPPLLLLLQRDGEPRPSEQRMTREKC